ncbi:unnamed protein product [Adineta steineri]|uniref:RNA-directed DNA polymerase n=1 Tax=Adineta steineri TaxID=433720 RepID=A0A819Y587_9BILA|nr:unnamed protein product [Adineta steineri]CAF0742744.1 unnamed protein product [Adineta steineri]CAF4142662.1 unnamed protein product [Adineta steineri]CAF4152589.1 unnamed protein product [Adineta steineri]
MATQSPDRLYKFDSTAFDWKEWEFLFETHAAVEGIVDETKKRNLLITLLDVQSFKTLMSICKPKQPSEYSYAEILHKLRTNYARVTFTSTECIKFFSIRQETSQSLTEFANILRNKATTCDFPSVFYERALITAFVGGLHNDNIRKHLMQKNLETLEATINTAKTIDTVLIEASGFRSNSIKDFAVNKINKQNKPDIKSKFNKTTCASCGSTDHARLTCRFRDVVCRNCKKSGHIAKVCRSTSDDNKKQLNSVSVLSIKKPDFDQPIDLRLQINNMPIKLQLDTGSPITLVTEQVWEQLGKPNLNQIKMNINSFTGHRITLKGERMVKVEYMDKSMQLKMHVVNGYGNNILGRDWIYALNLHTRTLDDIDSNGSTLNVNFGPESLNELMARHSEIFQEGLGCCKIKAHLHVKPDSIPKFCKPRSLPFAYREAVEQDLNRLINTGIIEPVDVSKWAAPVVVVPKPGGKVRLCADLSTGVNQSLEIDQYPLPKPNDLFVALNGGQQFSKIDFSEAYLQVALDDESKELLVINTHKGLFRYNRLPFGVASAPSIFQKIMDQMLAGLQGTVCYLDDIIVTGVNKMEHLDNLNKVLEKIKDFGFHINKSKCSFLQDSVEYLGFIVDKNGVHTSPSKTKAIVEMPYPTNISQLRSYLGMVNHYAKFIPNLTDRLAPFYLLLKKNTKWDWTSTCTQAFTAIKQSLIGPLVLTHYDPKIPLVLAADASNTGVGAVIYHRYSDGTEKAIAHASKTLTPTEKNYAQIEKEALALVYGVQKFDQFIRGRSFTLLTDHKPLLTIFGPKKGIPTTSANRLQRWALKLMGYNYIIEYRSTTNFGQADGLSRLPVGPDKQFDDEDPTDSRTIASIQMELQEELPLRASQIARATRQDILLYQVYTYILSGWPSTTPDNLQSYFRIRNELSTSQGCITWGLRTIIPHCYRKQLLDHLHSTHAGCGRMKSEARRYFWWPSLDKEIENVAKQCESCSLNSKQPAKSPLNQWPVPELPWQRIHIDYMGRFFNKFFLIIVDAHSKWLEVAIMDLITTTATIETLYSLFSRYGLCEEIVSDNGTQFTSKEFSDFCARHGIRHLRTSPGHPQSNGQAERYVDTVKSAIKKGISGGGGDLKQVLIKFLFSYRSTPHATTNISPAELFMKRQLRTVLDLIRPTAKDTSSAAQERYKHNFDRHTKEREFNVGDKVIVRDFRNATTNVKWTPGILINPIGNRLWNVQVDQQQWKRHENQIQLRYWNNNDDDVLIEIDQTPVSPDSQPNQQPQQQHIHQQPQLRRSSRDRKPVKRLINEI